MKSMKPCTSTALWDVEKCNMFDRLSSLPDELLLHILFLLPTKDAVATSVLSTRLKRVFPFITNLDFDVSSISLCVNRPYAIEKYPTFVTFVTAVLQAHKSEYLTRFRLNVGSAHFLSRYSESCDASLSLCKKDCVPDLKSLQLNAWTSFPLNRCGLRELDLCILVREPGDTQLPPAIFMCQTLEVLKLNINIGLHQVLAMPSYSLPSLKLLYFSVSFMSDDLFLPRLLASCPLLEDLEYQPFTEHVDHLIIQSTSLRRLCLKMYKVPDFQFDNSDFVHIDTPNLENFEYIDNLAFHYSTIPIDKHRLVEAKLCIWDMLMWDGPEVYFPLLLNLIKSVYYVQRLYLSGRILQVFNDVDLNLQKDQLPVFPNMKHLSLGGAFYYVFWDKILLPLLNSWPVLETLVFLVGVTSGEDDFPDEQMLEQNFFTTAHPIPPCCRYHLKTIIIKEYLGKQREQDFIQFILRHALVLENLIIHRFHSPQIPAPDVMSVEGTLRSLPKASMSCSIQVL